MVGCRGVTLMRKLRHPAWRCSALFAIAAALVGLVTIRQSVPQPPSPLIGTWQNTAVPYKYTMHIAYSPPFYAVSLDLQTASCGGGMDGLATYDEAKQTLLLQTPAADEEVCTIRIHIQNQQATITESSACLYHHGVACNFEGRFEKTRFYFLEQSTAATMKALSTAINF